MRSFLIAIATSGMLACSAPIAGHPADTPLPLFTPPRPIKTIAPLPGQSKAIEDLAVAFDIDHPEAIPVGFGAGAQQYQEPLRSMLLRVEGLAGYRFDWLFNPSLGDIAMSFPGGSIVFNPNVASRVSADAFFFTLMHECGHEVLGHTSQAAIVNKMYQPWLAPSMELDADAYAATRLKSAGVNSSRILTAAMEIIGGSPGDRTHPPGPVRIKNIRRALTDGPQGDATAPSRTEAPTPPSTGSASIPGASCEQRCTTEAATCRNDATKLDACIDDYAQVRCPKRCLSQHSAAECDQICDRNYGANTHVWPRACQRKIRAECTHEEVDCKDSCGAE